MKNSYAVDKLNQQGFKLFVADSSDVLYRMVKERENYNIHIDIFVENVDGYEKNVVSAFKYITDKKTGIQFARHSVFNAKAGTIHAALSEEELTSLAYSITAEAFCGVLDKGGRPYFEHCLAVSRKLGPVVNERYKQIAVMHDIIEDISHYNTLVLEDLGFSKMVYMGVFYLSKLPSRKEIYTNGKVDLFKYMNIIMEHRECLLIKMSDLQHNSDLRRLKGVTERDHERTNTYAIWYSRLKDHGIIKGWL